jgi:hypothetical protein
MSIVSQLSLSYQSNIITINRISCTKTIAKKTQLRRQINNVNLKINKIFKKTKKNKIITFFFIYKCNNIHYLVSRENMNVNIWFCSLKRRYIPFKHLQQDLRNDKKKLTKPNINFI